MHYAGLTVRQKDNPKVPALLLVNSRPTPDASVSLLLPLPICNDVLNPFVFDDHSVKTRANDSKLLRNFHGARVLVIPAVLPTYTAAKPNSHTMER